jgi:hypothetical protein
MRPQWAHLSHEGSPPDPACRVKAACVLSWRAPRFGWLDFVDDRYFVD